MQKVKIYQPDTSHNLGGGASKEMWLTNLVNYT